MPPTISTTAGSAVQILRQGTVIVCTGLLFTMMSLGLRASRVQPPEGSRRATDPSIDGPASLRSPPRRTLSGLCGNFGLLGARQPCTPKASVVDGPFATGDHRRPLIARDEHLTQDVGAVGDDRVDPGIEQTPHDLGFVDGPGHHPHPEVV